MPFINVAYFKLLNILFETRIRSFESAVVLKYQMFRTVIFKTQKNNKLLNQTKARHSFFVIFKKV